MRTAVFEEVRQFRPGRAFRRAQQPRHRERAARVGELATRFERLVAQPAAQEAGHEGIAGAEHVVDLDREAWAGDAVVDVARDRAGERDAAFGTPLADDDCDRCRRADRADGRERVLGAAGDVQLLLGADDQVAQRQHVGQQGGHAGVADVAAFARAVACQTPEVRAKVDVEHHAPAVLACHRNRERLGCGRGGAAEVRAGYDDGGRAGDERRVDVARLQRRVGAIGAIEDQRERRVVAHAQQHQRRQPVRVGDDAARVDALAP